MWAILPDRNCVLHILLYGIVQGWQKYTVRQSAVSAPCNIMCLDIIVKCTKLCAKHYTLLVDLSAQIL